MSVSPRAQLEIVKGVLHRAMHCVPWIRLTELVYVSVFLHPGFDGLYPYSAVLKQSALVKRCTGKHESHTTTSLAGTSNQFRIAVNKLEVASSN